MDTIFLHTYFDGITLNPAGNHDRQILNFVTTWKGGLAEKLAKLDKKMVDQYLQYIQSLQLRNYYKSDDNIIDKIRIESAVTITTSYNVLQKHKSFWLEPGTILYGTNLYVTHESSLRSLSTKMYLALNNVHQNDIHHNILYMVHNGCFGYIFETPYKDWFADCLDNINDDGQYAEKTHNVYPKRLYLIGKQSFSALQTVINQNVSNFNVVLKNYYSGIQLIPKQFNRAHTKSYVYHDMSRLRNLLSTELGNSNSCMLCIQRDYIFDIKNIPAKLTEMLSNYVTSTSHVTAVYIFGNEEKALTKNYYLDRIKANEILLSHANPFADLHINLHSILLNDDMGIQIKNTNNAFYNEKYGVCIIKNYSIFGSVITIKMHENLIKFQHTLRAYAKNKIFHIRNQFYIISLTATHNLNIWLLVKSSAPQIAIENVKKLQDSSVKNTLAEIIQYVN